ncbi:hypothetical protein [Acinetobacter ursingii]|uniref:hypothetical protein n=1 Tax=Acinetobacter ursingii TaxID=108980 RepID=UPI0021CDA0F7|nr:hypothetical protein [Acinetobacter ursingii]MCU4483765.1 hypothetical protein [Acinetobacter ursingii]MCU4508085.1 hypothetical protein [Acinetobacter ursingii]MCU4571044.1 hypothetical protein [Acinetobacter ursingii]
MSFVPDLEATTRPKANVDAEKASQVSPELMYIIFQHWSRQLLYITKGDGFSLMSAIFRYIKEFIGHHQVI